MRVQNVPPFIGSSFGTTVLVYPPCSYIFAYKEAYTVQRADSIGGYVVSGNWRCVLVRKKN